MDWENIRYFLAVADSGSLSGAARKLKVDHATVSRRLSALEAEFGVRFVDRLARSCRLTSVGEQILERALAMQAGAEGIGRLAQAAAAPLETRISLSAPPVLVTNLLAQQLARFQSQHPEIMLAMSAEGQQISLSRRDSDVALRLVRPTEPGNVVRKIGRMQFALYAHRNYVYLGAPERWKFVAFEKRYADMPQQRWLLAIAGTRPTACELNHITEHLIAAQTGAAVAGLPCFLGDSDPDLVRLDQETAPFERDVWLAVHHDLHKMAAIRAVLDFVTSAVCENAYLSLR